MPCKYEYQDYEGWYHCKFDHSYNIDSCPCKDDEKCYEEDED